MVLALRAHGFLNATSPGGRAAMRPAAAFLPHIGFGFANRACSAGWSADLVCCASGLDDQWESCVVTAMDMAELSKRGPTTPAESYHAKSTARPVDRVKLRV